MDEKEAEARPLMGTIFLVYIGECGSTLYVGLSRIVRNLIQKSTV